MAIGGEEGEEGRGLEGELFVPRYVDTFGHLSIPRKKMEMEVDIDKSLANLPRSVKKRVNRTIHPSVTPLPPPPLRAF